MMRFSIMLVSSLISTLLIAVLANTDEKNDCGVDFAFAGTYGSHMVLQRAPARARIWGYGFNVGDAVTVSISDGGEYETTTTEGNAGRPIWKVEFAPVTEGGPHTINATSAGCALTLEDILFGDVWLCSGQSNMVFRLEQLDNPQSEIDDVVNYTNIRTFMTELTFSYEPQEDVSLDSRSWDVTTPELMSSFSALCWLFGKRLYDKYQVPIGLIQAAWGGTRIEAWSSPVALDVCFVDHSVTPMDTENGASVLYNAMIHPFLPMPIFGAIWYQGEQNEGKPLTYSCSLREMVADWRHSWFIESDSMDPQFPFGQVQLAPNNPGDVRAGFPDIRWQQTSGLGFVPNNQLQRFFMAVAMDLPDFDSPYGSIHPRYKRQIADRLALGAFHIAYGDSSSGPHQGPTPVAVQRVESAILLTYSHMLHTRGDPENNRGFEVCCAADSAVTCEDRGPLWTLSDISSVGGNTVTLQVPCSDDFPFVTGIRYSWLESPCLVLQQCPLYADDTGNRLPVPPYLFNGHIN